MIRQWLGAAVPVVLVSVLCATAYAGDKDKDKKDPEWLEFTLLKGGAPAGEFGFKTVASASAKIFTSSKLELKNGKKVTLLIQTHVERDPDGTLVKYKKWIGKQQGSADHDLIAFWPYEKKMRIVSRTGKKFKTDLTPGRAFCILDDLGYHLYADLAGIWKEKGAGTIDCVLLHEGKTEKVTLAQGGAATLKRGEEELVVQAVAVSGRGLDLTLLVGEKPRYLGFSSKDLVMLRHGYALVSIDPDAKAAAEAPVAQPPEAKPEEKPEEKPVGPPKEPAKEEGKAPQASHPPLPE